MNSYQLQSVFLSLAILIVSVSTAFSQQVHMVSANGVDSSVIANTGTAANTSSIGTPLAQNVITSIKLEGDTTKKGDIKPLRADFNKRIIITVSGSPAPFANQDNDAIYINNILMPYKVNFNCPCVGGSQDTTFTLTCQLTKTDTTWNKWYGFRSDSLDVKVDVGTKLKQYTCSTQNNLRISMYRKAGLIWAWAFTGILIILSILLAFFLNTNLIKDKSTAEKKPYSLSRFQLLWWTVIIISCYILLFAIRDDFALLSQSTLILLGISVAGTGFAAVVDYSQNPTNPNLSASSDGFIIDVLSDDNGISVHRYQNLIFTFIFGIIFVYKVLATGNMPDFGVLELSLMGLSTAAYVGLKTGENKPATTNTTTTNNTVSPNDNIVG